MNPEVRSEKDEGRTDADEFEMRMETKDTVRRRRLMVAAQRRHEAEELIHQEGEE